MIHEGYIKSAQRNISRLSDEQRGIVYRLARHLATSMREPFCTDPCASPQYRMACLDGRVAWIADTLAAGLFAGDLSASIDAVEAGLAAKALCWTGETGRDVAAAFALEGAIVESAD